MPTYSTPGVYVTESPLASITPATQGVTSAAFFGEAARGPLSPVLIQDWTTYKNVYGDLENKYDLGYAVFHYFANGGRGCYVRRVLDSAAVAASKASFPFYPTGNTGASTGTGASAGLFTVSAVSAGTWGNDLTVQTLLGNVPGTPTTFASFTIVVSLKGVEVERWPDVTLDPNANRYVVAVVNNYSRFIKVTNLTTAASAGSLLTYSYLAAFPLAGGTQASVVQDTDYNSALTDLDGLEGNLILNAVGKTSSTIVSSFITKAADRGDSFVIIDPNATDADLNALQATAANYAGLANAGYAAHYTPMLLMVDPAKTGPGAIRNTYPGGAVAGLYVRTEVERTVAKAPAGYAADIRGALGLSIALTDTQIGTLYDGSPQVNSFKAVPGAGVVVWGARTLQKNTIDKFVNVRRTLNYLKVSLKNLTGFAIFEANDSFLWSLINLRVSGFLSDFWRSGGLKGARASDAFFIICDHTNNTATSIDAGIVNVSVGVALQKPAEFIVINLSQWTGGSNAVESL